MIFTQIQIIKIDWNDNDYKQKDEAEEYNAEIDNLINNNDENKDIISLEIKSEKNDEKNSKNNNIHESLVKEEKENLNCF